MSVLFLLVLSISLYVITWWSTGWGLSPDGFQYERMVAGQLVPSPYHRRIALPWLMGQPFWSRWSLRMRWIAWGVAWTILSGVLTSLYVGGSFEKQALALLLFAGLPGIWRLNVRLPVLVDSTAYSLTLMAALLFRSGHPVLGMIVAVLGAATKETVPLFVATLTLNPWPLFALAVPWYAHRRRPKREPTAAEPYLQRPMHEARKVHDFFDWRSKLLPWGVLIFLAPLGFSCNGVGISALMTLTLGYGQLLIAQDNARLFQWAAPAVLAMALDHPPSWVWFAALVGLFNPYRGT